MSHQEQYPFNLIIAAAKPLAVTPSKQALPVPCVRLELNVRIKEIGYET